MQEKMQDIIEALEELEKEKGISKDFIMDAIEKSINSACEKEFGKDMDYSVVLDRTTGRIQVYSKKLVVEEVYNSLTEISVEDAKKLDPNYEKDDEIPIEITTMDFGRIAAQKARGIIVQSIKEGERDANFRRFAAKKDEIITGVVQRFAGRNVIVNLDERTDAKLSEMDMIPNEIYRRGDRIALYITKVEPNKKEGFQVRVSRTVPGLVLRLFEREVTEIADGIVKIRSISREAGFRSKIAVWSTDENVDAVGSCVGLNGARVNAIVDQLNGEKIDIIEWDPKPDVFIEHALSPSKVVSVTLSPYDNSALVIVPDNQLSLAIGKEGQNARLAAKLTGYKIDIKSEEQAYGLDIDEYFDEKYRRDHKDEEYSDEYDEYDEEFSDASAAAEDGGQTE